MNTKRWRRAIAPSSTNFCNAVLRAAKSVRENDESWQRFVGHAFWTKRNKNGMARQQKLKRELKHALRYALIFMLRARTESAKQLARKTRPLGGQAP